MSTTPVQTEAPVQEQTATEGQEPQEQQQAAPDAPEGTEEQSTEQTEEQEKPEGDSEDSEEGQDDKHADLPEWVRNELSSTRREAARYRTALREAEAKLAGAKSAEEVESAVADLKAKNAELERELTAARVAAKFQLPQELAEVLKGNTREELEAHAKVLSRFAGSREPEELSGGLDPREAGDGSFDPAEAARKARAARFSR